MKKTAFIFLIMIVFICGCENDSEIASNKESKKIIFGRVSLINYKIEAGNPDDELIRQGLADAVKALSSIIEDASTAGRDVHGEMTGSFRIESNGIVRMFLEGESKLQNDDNPSVVDKFVGTIFGKKWSFPEIGQPSLVSVKFKIKKAS
jgi:hypothetical protein